VVVAWGKLGWCGEAGLDLEDDSKQKLVFKFQMNLNFGKTLINFKRRFRRNLDLGFSLNSCRILKEF
jgi:hypothetical protein